ncbi:putative VP2 [Microviridae sp.]|nr:putative VP2 [Microviridae sp.]
MKLFGENFNTGTSNKSTPFDTKKYDTSGKSLFTRFVVALNNFFNPSHSWFDYSTWKDSNEGGLENLFKGVTQSGVTAQQAGLNEMQMQNQEDIYQRQVTGMQKAGLNPALMYNSGSSSAPSAPSGTNMAGVSMSDLLQAMMIPTQIKMMKAQTENILASADQKRAQTETEGIRQESLRLANQYYPSVQEATLDKIFSEIGVNDRTMDEKEANAALTWSKQFLQEKENKFADDYFHWRNELEKAKTGEAIQSAANHMASAAWIGYQQSYAKSHGALLSGSPLVALAGMLSQSLSNIFGVRENGLDGSLPSIEEVVTKAVKSAVGDEKPKPRHRLKTQRELDAEDRWKRKTGWQKFRAIMENMD